MSGSKRKGIRRSWLAVWCALLGGVLPWVTPGYAATGGTSEVLTAADVIAKARAWRGDEAALERVETMILSGSFEAPQDGVKGLLRIYLAKPLRQRMEVETETHLEVTVLDDFEGWQLAAEKDVEGSGRVRVLAPAALRRMRANTADHLYFYEGPQQLFGHCEHLGSVKTMGQAAWLVVFHYPGDLAYQRSFAQATGRLLMTRNDRGLEIREEGELIVDGIRFPQQLISVADGRVTNIVRFSEVRLNEPIEDELFSMPSTRVFSGLGEK